MMKQILFSLSLLAVVSVEAHSPVIQIERVKSDKIEENFSTFRFKLAQGTQKQKYQVIAKDILGKQEILHPELKLNKDGTLVDKNGEPFTFCPVAMGLGEPLSIAVSSKDKKEHAEATLIPRPFVTQLNGYSLTLQLIDAQNNHFQMYARGFQPNEKVTLYSQSGHKEIEQEIYANAQGEIIATLSHTCLKKQGGYAYLEVVGNNGLISVDYPWGTLYEKEMRETRIKQEKLFRTLVLQK